MLVPSHKVPRERGGEAVPENADVVCEECNAGMEGYFKPLDPEWTGTVMAHRSVHVRLGETLKAFKGAPVGGATLRFVANQADWKKRIRELRYLGWDIETFNRRISETRVSSFYRLVRSRPWPADPSGVIRQYERDRAEPNRAEQD